jgi:Protein  of unknown function (DUF3018)
MKQYREVIMTKNVSARVQKHRDKLRASGLRPIQIWVPDARRLGFSEECQRQSKLLLNDSQEKEILDWIVSCSDDEGWK